MQLISEKTGQEIGRVPNRIEQEQDPMSIGIDFVDVAESHVLFFGRVKDFILGELPELAEDLSEFKQCCELEHWLHGFGAERFGQLSSFGRLHHAHAEFHRHAEEVLAKVHAGSWVAAEHMRKKELSQALRRVLITLTELNESINKQAWSVS
ncbi:MAG: CZB domain-containing protein [Sideroxydans sp.]